VKLICLLQVILEAMGTPRPIMLQILLTLDMALIKYVIWLVLHHLQNQSSHPFVLIRSYFSIAGKCCHWFWFPVWN